MPLGYRATRRTDCAKRRAAAWRRPVAALTRSPRSADTPACGKWGATPAQPIRPGWRVMRWPGPERQHLVANLAEPSGKPALNILKSLKCDVRSTNGAGLCRHRVNNAVLRTDRRFAAHHRSQRLPPSVSVARIALTTIPATRPVRRISPKTGHDRE